jgi:hypothetical protein
MTFSRTMVLAAGAVNAGYGMAALWLGRPMGLVNLGVAAIAVGAFFWTGWVERQTDLRLKRIDEIRAEMEALAKRRNTQATRP